MNEIIKSRIEQGNKSRDFSRFGLWSAVLYSSAFNTIGIIVGLILLLILSFTTVELTFNEEPFSSSELYFNLGINAISITIMGLLVLLFNRRITFIPMAKKQFNLTKKDGKIIGLAIMLIFAIVGMVQIIPEIIREQFFHEVIIETPFDFFGSEYIGITIFATFIVSILSPISEEIFYRWSMISILRNGFSKNATILFSALIFGLAHSTTDLNYSFYYFIMHFITTFLIGVVLGAVFFHINKILPLIILHTIWNFVLSLSGFFDFASIGWIYNIIFYIIVTCCFIGSVCFGIIVLVKRHKNKTREKITHITVDQTLEPEIKIYSKSMKKIKLKGEWFELILIYFLLIALLPILLDSSTIFFNFLQGYINLVYFLGIGIISIFVLLRIFNEKLIFYFPKEFNINSKTTEQIENKEREKNPP
ncbi:MAG: CPBP family intramembrane metalloprotease [Candidatus Heimdallarchaeota archaeon]|nr:CPBP family intramembrane metalloprotease [Candidatus Heimdallarchaeota archaeon]